MVDGGEWWMVVDGLKKSSRILLKFFSHDVQVILMCGNLENLRKTFFLPEKNPTSTFKKWGFLIKFSMGKSAFFLKVRCFWAHIPYR